MHFLLVYLPLFIITSSSSCKAECARKKAGSDVGVVHESGTAEPAKAPGTAPLETLISCTFMHNDRSEVDQHFSADVLAVLDEITQRLKREVRLSLTIEEVNCAEDEQSKCSEYSLQESFHWLVVDDPRHGAAVYEISEKLNSKRAIIEASLLDALSRHSAHDLTPYCSKDADKEVGFVRQLTSEELIGKQRKQETKKYKSAIARSPFELDLIEPILLEKRTFEKPVNWQQLRHMDAEALNAAISKDSLTFVLFWNTESAVSQHTFYVWAEASQILVPRYPEAVFSAVACHELGDLCEDYVTTASEQHTIFVFKKNDIFAKTQELRDPQYYLDWVHLLMEGPAQEIHSDDELKQLKMGKLESFEEIRPAITVGIFNDRECRDAKIFMQVAENLMGRYHFVYYIKNSHPSSVYTIRVRERKKRVDFTGVFEIHELTSFVIHSSLPSMIDISNGFTSDILTHQPLPIILLVGGNEQEKSSFSELCFKTASIICTVISNTKSKRVSRTLQALQVNDQSDQLVVFLREKIYSLDVKNSQESNSLLQIIALAAVEKPISILALEDVHPLRYLQVAQLDEVFGEQPTEIPSEVQFIQRAYRDKHGMGTDNNDYGGCPVMAHARQMMQEKDEL